MAGAVRLEILNMGFWGSIEADSLVGGRARVVKRVKIMAGLERRLCIFNVPDDRRPLGRPSG